MTSIFQLWGRLTHILYIFRIWLNQRNYLKLGIIFLLIYKTYGFDKVLKNSGECWHQQSRDLTGVSPLKIFILSTWLNICAKFYTFVTICTKLTYFDLTALTMSQNWQDHSIFKIQFSSCLPVFSKKESSWRLNRQINWHRVFLTIILAEILSNKKI